MSTSDPPPFEAEHPPQLSAAWSATCGGAVWDIQISKDGVVAVATESGIRLFVGEREFTLLQELPTSPAKLTAFKFSRGGGEVITGASDGFLKWWDVNTGEETCSTQFPVTKGGDDQEEEEPAGEAPAISALACSTEGELVAATGGRTVCIFGHGGVHLHTIGPLISPVVAMEWRSASELAVNVGSGIQMFTIEEDHYEVGQGLGAEVDGGSLTVVAAAPGEKLLAAGCSNGSVQIWNLENGDEESSVSVKGCQQNTYDTEVACLAWDEGGNFLATAGGSEVIVWDMSDNCAELKDGKDDCIVCYGHDQKAKITALAFQPGGKLLATGGDDCQVLVFDSANFSSNGESVVSGLVGSLSSGRVVPEGTGASVTAVAWHPSGLVLAGTSSGKVDAFEVVPGVDGGDAEKEKSSAEAPFLIANPEMPRRRTPRQQGAMQGWGGQPLIANNGGPENQHTAEGWQGFGSRKSNGSGGNMVVGGRRGPRHQGGTRAKDILNQVKSSQTSRPPYPEGAQQAWPAVIHPAPMGMMRWPPMAYPTHVQYPQYLPQQVPQAPVMGPYGPNPQTGSFVKPGQVPAGPSMIPRMPMPPPQTGQYPMAYMPFAQPFPMGFPQQYAYYAQMGPQHLQEQMPAQPPTVMGPGGMSNPSTQMPSKRPTNGMQREASSPDLNEDAASKSSERTNNGVNSMGPVTPSESSTSYEQDNGRMAQGVVTLYIGNLAPQVDENLLLTYFAPYGQISNVQVIRDRDTKQSRGFAFITYGHPVWAQSAMTNMDGATFPGPFEGRRLKVSFSNRRP